MIGTGASAPTSTVTEDATSATVSVTSPQGKYKLTFAKTGTLAGHVTSMDSSGNVTCDEDLGAQAQSPDGGIGNGDGGGVDDGGGDDGGGGGGGGGGCGCSTPAERTGNAAAVFAGVAFVVISRRRRRARA